MEIKEYFDQFWNDGSTYLQINNSTRTYNNLNKKLSGFSDFYQIDDYVCSLKTEKESTRKIMVAFFDYLKKKEGISVESVLYNKRFFDYPFERQLEIAKFLHEPRTTKEICERFDISARTCRNDLNMLENGLEVLGSTIRVEKIKMGGKYSFKSTMHPIFLPLNLTEVQAITDYLEYLLRNGNAVYSSILYDIVNRIKAQLSPYAFTKIFPEKHQPKGNEYLSEEALAHQRKSALGYLNKSGTHFKFIYNNCEYGGVLKSSYSDLKIALDDGSILAVKPNEIEVLLDSYQYK